MQPLKCGSHLNAHVIPSLIDMKLGLFDVVKLEVELPDVRLSEGDAGTVVFDFQSARNAYEVEFFDSQGRTLVTMDLL